MLIIADQYFLVILYKCLCNAVKCIIFATKKVTRVSAISFYFSLALATESVHSEMHFLMHVSNVCQSVYNMYF